MKLSTKARYGLNAVCVLAENYGEVLTLQKIADGAGITEQYLEQLFLVLRKSGIVGAQRGAGGGYFLAKDPSELSVGEVARILEDGLEIVDCISGECNNKSKCKTYGVWRKVYDAINKTLDDISIASLVNDCKCKKQS